jgi:hypothetical protein
VTEAREALNAVAKIGKGQRKKTSRPYWIFKRFSVFRLRIQKSRFYNYAFLERV